MDYERIGLKVGLEIHQQLNTRRKLFCGCPTVLREKEDATLTFKRFLRVARSELGEVDEAALEEEKKQRTFIYKAYDSTCLVENDEEPPSELNEEALDIALEIALLLHMKPVEEVHTMRKIVIDGSNTSGFQRTALVATDGWIESEEGIVGIETLCLEEEAAQKIEEGEDAVVYSLDRLGIPLVEISTAPDIKTPKQARKIAEKIGMILRSTGKVKRGIGTIRQDLNISIKEGARVEIKGVQDLRLIEKIVENEVKRQLKLLEIRDELRRRGARVERRVLDLSDIFAETRSRVVKKQGKVFGACLRGFGGILGIEISPERRFGSELADHAKRFGVGLMHTDELPAYGISEEEVRRVKEAFNATAEDCVILIASASQERAEKAFSAVFARAEKALEGVPEETRRALPNGSTAYLRPLPGAARMYPETDVPPVEVSEERVKRIASSLPETIEQKEERFRKEYGLSGELAAKVARTYPEVFERLVNVCARKGWKVQPKLIATLLTDTLTELSREGFEIDAESFDFEGIFRLLAENAFGKEAIPEILKFLASHEGASVEDAVEALGLRVSLDEVERFIENVVRERAEFVRERGISAVGPLMGVVMKDLRGKVDGKVVSEMLKAKIEAFLRGSEGEGQKEE